MASGRHLLSCESESVVVPYSVGINIVEIHARLPTVRRCRSARDILPRTPSYSGGAGIGARPGAAAVVLVDDRSAGGRWFHVAGPLTAKLRCPVAVRARGTSIECQSLQIADADDLRWH